VNKKPYEAGYKQPTWKHQDEPYQNIKQLFAEELQKVVFVTEGGVTKSTTKAAVIAAQLVNRAMAGDRTLLLLLLKIAGDLPPPAAGEASVFRLTPEEQELIDIVKKRTETKVVAEREPWPRF
jgi:hypothetical protein